MVQAHVSVTADDSLVLSKDLPLLLDSGHVMKVLGRGRDSALRTMKSGALGPCTMIGRCHFVFRDLAIQALLDRALELAPSPSPRRVGSERARHYAKRLNPVRAAGGGRPGGGP